jgi:hypothetical protein
MHRLVPCLLVLAATTLAQAPPGYKTYENKLAALQFFYPVAYQELPLPPTEQVLVAKFLLKDKPAELKRVDDALYKAIEQQIHVYHFALPAAVTGAAPAKPAEGEEKPADGKPSTVREAMEQRSRVASWDEFAKRFGAWRLDEDARKPGYFKLVFTGDRWPLPDIKPVGYLVKKQVGSEIFGVYGFTLTPCEKALVNHVQKMANGLDLADEGGNAAVAAEAAIDKLYASGKFRAVDKRKQARSELPKGWRAVDTENYLIVHHSKNEGLVNQIAREIEAMRLLYSELFPPTGPMDALSIVRVCRTKDEYHQYGGPPGTGGYWHPGNEELVFYDYSYTMKTLDKDERRAMGGRILTDDDSMLVLYHEAFHQYIYYAIGEFSPHDWFNEGYGDYFSGAVVPNNTGKVSRIDPSPWRIHRIKDMCEYGEGFVPLKQVLEAERAVFYHPSRVGAFYASAWSFVFFLKHDKEALAHEQWSKILPNYLANVTKAYREEVAALGEKPTLEQKTVAGFNARKRAHKETFGGIDLDALEKAWRQYVIQMRDPWPSQRKKRK